MGQLYDLQRGYTDTSVCHTNVDVTSAWSTVRSGYTKSMTDVVVPDFHRRKERGEIFCNPLWVVETTEGYSLTPAHYQRNNVCGAGNHVYYTTDLYGADTDYGLFLPSPTVSADLATLAGTQAKASVMEPDVFALVELAEAKETFKLLAKPLDDTYEFIRKVQRSRGFRRYAGSLGSYIANNWLKYRYGLTPLALSMQDVWSLVTADRSGRRRTARGYASATATDSNSFVGTQYAAYGLSHSQTASLKRSVRAGVLYEWNFDWVVQGGLSLSEIPSALYELVPYSFVEGWFGNLGDVIRAVTPRGGVKPLASWTTTRDEYHATHDVTFQWKSPTGYTETQHPTFAQTREVKTTSRHPGLSVGYASKISLIDWEKPADWLHTADALALLSQRLKP